VRRDSSMENLAKLKPFFDRKYGNVTPGNSSQITDGGAWLILASEEAVKRHDLNPIGRTGRRTLDHILVERRTDGVAPIGHGVGFRSAAGPDAFQHFR